MNEEILEILKLLDHDDDDHWTDDGLPRVDLVKRMVGDDEVIITRETISNTAPKLVRGKPFIDPENIEEVVPKEPVKTIEEKMEVRDEYQVRLNVLEEDLAEINEAIRLATGEKEAKDLEIQDLINERDQIAPPITPIEAIRQIERNNIAERRKRAERNKQLGFTPSALSHTMKSSGQRRPDYNAHLKRV